MFFFVIAGRLDNEFKDQARCAFGNSSAEYIVAAGDHEETYIRMWLHAVTSTAQTVFINIPDTDVYFIGLSILKNTNLHEKSVYVQPKDSPDNNIVIDMNQFASDLRNDICLQEVENIEECIQILYIISGCDYISYFNGFGKKTFFDDFRKKTCILLSLQVSRIQISDIAYLSNVNSNTGLCSFYRLISTVYFSRHCSVYLPGKFWSQAYVNFLKLSLLSDLGWKVNNDSLECMLIKTLKNLNRLLTGIQKDVHAKQDIKPIAVNVGSLNRIQRMDFVVQDANAPIVQIWQIVLLQINTLDMELSFFQFMH
jgi:hypothetical protein